MVVVVVGRINRTCTLFTLASHVSSSPFPIKCNVKSNASTDKGGKYADGACNEEMKTKDIYFVHYNLAFKLLLLPSQVYQSVIQVMVVLIVIGG